MVSEIVIGEVAQLVVAGIQAYRLLGNEKMIGAKVDEMAKQGASMAQIAEYLRSNTLKEEVDAQAKIDKARTEGA